MERRATDHDAPADASSRRLAWHGIAIVLVGLLIGNVVPAFTNPRMGLSAHLGGVTTGPLLVVIGLLWPSLRLAPAARAVACWGSIVGGWALLAALLASAVLGTSAMTPIAGAGFRAGPLAEGFVIALLVVGAVAIQAGVASVLYGLRSR